MAYAYIKNHLIVANYIYGYGHVVSFLRTKMRNLVPLLAQTELDFYSCSDMKQSILLYNLQRSKYLIYLISKIIFKLGDDFFLWRMSWNAALCLILRGRLYYLEASETHLTA